MGESGYCMSEVRPRRVGDFCDTCHSFDLYSFNTDPQGFRGYKYSHAREAAVSGCPFCSFLIGTFQTKLRTSPRQLPPGWEESWWIHLGLGLNSRPTPQDVEQCGSGLGVQIMKAILAPVDINSAHGPRLPKGLHPTVEFHVAADPDSPAATSGDVRGRYVGENTQSQDSLVFMENWLKVCRAHPKCRRTMSGESSIHVGDAPLPTICVEVGQSGAWLEETGAKRGKYITVSHRWTSAAQQCRTTMDNIRRRKRKQSSWWKALPKTFLDVIELARSLRVRYVWIDSLCIIQSGDGGADWSRESTRMADYYQYSLFTVAATSASTDRGLFPKKTSKVPRLARLPYHNTDGYHQGHFYVYSYSWEVDKHYLSFIRDSELLSRGWVFQEWLLSRRIVYFTPAGMLWECAEQQPHNERGEIAQTYSADDVLEANQPPSKHSFDVSHAAINPMWYRIVAAYSTLSLTKPEHDRVVALAGISKEFKTSLLIERASREKITSTVPASLEFVSGLWLPDLHRGLLWECHGSNLRRMPRFPSWSWATILSPVQWDERRKSTTFPAAELVALTTSEGRTFSTQFFASADDCVYLNHKIFDIDTCFVTLGMKAKALDVLVRHCLQDQECIELVSSASGHDTKSDKAVWRAVCSTLRPTEISGWVSIEGEDYQEDALFESGREMRAIHISTARKVDGGYGVGNLSIWHSVFNVLLVKSTHGNTYERIGVARLFGREFEKQIKGATVYDIELV